MGITGLGMEWSRVHL
nr:unnamed protein product [Callosobruchus chinensis]